MTRRKSADGAPGKNAVDPIQVFAERLRDHKSLESRWAVMQENRVEYFRGKDFVSMLKANPDLVKDGLGSDEEEVANLLLRTKLILRCERVVKSLRPGKKKLSKWPARLQLCPDQSFSQNDAFYAWTFERKRPLWQTVLSFLLPVLTLACCLFPLFPHWCKLVVMYLCLTLLVLIFGILIIRWMIFGLSYILLGKRVWFFPNILADDASFSEIIKFWPEPPKEDEKPPKWTSRLAFTCVTIGVVWFCVRHSPDEAARARYQKGVSNIIDEILEWSPKLALSGKVEEAAPANITEATESTQPANEKPDFSNATEGQDHEQEQQQRSEQEI
ncbi:uncharacterized protein LOC9633460 [Selaginella moellendorffii]|nr:uncharacterized protein LOC9633460 [Selaginella moellendorffii]|eukprot:XP_002970672.2 uncharacterized protein LOC9633460 [Selaginella moellendorffii]